MKRFFLFFKFLFSLLLYSILSLFFSFFFFLNFLLFFNIFNFFLFPLVSSLIHLNSCLHFIFFSFPSFTIWFTFALPLFFSLAIPFPPYSFSVFVIFSHCQVRSMLSQFLSVAMRYGLRSSHMKMERVSG